MENQENNKVKEHEVILVEDTIGFDNQSVQLLREHMSVIPFTIDSKMINSSNGNYKKRYNRKNRSPF